MNIIVLETELFPDQDKVKGALETVDNKEHSISRINLAGLTADDHDAWDMVVKGIMKAAKVITI